MSKAPTYERYAHISKAKVIELFERGLSHREIGKELGMSRVPVGRWLRKAGKVRANPRNSARNAHIPVAKVIELHDLGMNNRQIGTEFGMAPSTVGRWLMKAGKAGKVRKISMTKVVELFERGLSYTRIGNRLGIHPMTVLRWLRKAGKVQANPPRSDRCAKVVELFDRGLSYSQIGKELGLHSRTVQKWLRNAGKVRANPRSCERYAHIPTAKVIELHDLGMNNRQIGKELGMGPSTVGQWLRKAGKATPKAVTAEQLKESRLDPAWEARQGTRNRVVCRKCGALKPSLNDSKCNHLLTHNLTTDEYKSKYPGAPLMSFDIEASHLRWHYRRSSHPTKTGHELMIDCAAKYLTPEELKECRKHSQWEEHHGIKDFVACRLCGFKCKWRLGDHLMSRHGISSAAYRLRFPKSLLLPLSKEDSERDRSRKKGRALRARAAKLPDDWYDVPIKYRIIATELFSKSTMSNRELGKRLDGSQLIECPYGHNWETVLTKPGSAANFVWKVRTWINRPGQKIA